MTGLLRVSLPLQTYLIGTLVKQQQQLERPFLKSRRNRQHAPGEQRNKTGDWSRNETLMREKLHLVPPQLRRSSAFKTSGKLAVPHHSIRFINLVPVNVFLADRTGRQSLPLHQLSLNAVFTSSNPNFLGRRFHFEPRHPINLRHPKQNDSFPCLCAHRQRNDEAFGVRYITRKSAYIAQSTEPSLYKKQSISIDAQLPPEESRHCFTFPDKIP